MKYFYLTTLVFFSFLSFGQCPTGSITLTSQAEVDAFAINYPNCTELNDSLTISGDDIVDLSPLSQITSIEFGIEITNNPLLENLDDLSLLTSNPIFILEISNNTSLTDISGLSNLSYDAGLQLSIRNNPLLNSLDGLQNIASTEDINIWNNDSLLNFDGLNNLTSTTSFTVYGNDSLINLFGLGSLEGSEIVLNNNSSLQNLVGLTSVFYGGVSLVDSNVQSLEGLEAVSSLGYLFLIDNAHLSDISSIENISSIGWLEIINNPNLSVCSLNPICDIIDLWNNTGNPNTVIIENNAPGCNSIPEVDLACGIIPINDECIDAITISLDQTFEAYNTNGTQSPQIPNCNDSANRVDVWFTFTTSDEGIFDIVVEGGTYNLQVWEGDCSSLTLVPNSCDMNEILDANLAYNTTYYLQVWSDELSRATGLFDVSVYNTTLSDQDFNFSEFVLYPNPTKSTLNFKANTIVDSITIFNAIGQKTLLVTPNNTIGTIDTSDLSSGLYFVEVKIGNNFNTFKIIKE